jgi:hypothetical protein
MFPGYAATFAKASLRLFRHEGRFAIDIPQGLDLEDVAQEYESYGHHVERDPNGHQLCVVCVPDPSA